MVILGLLTAVALPSFQAWLYNSQIYNVAESISNGLQRARAEAVARNTNVEFVLSADTSWSVRVVNGGDVVDSRASGEGAKNVSVAQMPSNANNTVTFNNLGSLQSPNPSDGSEPFTAVNVDSTALSSAESRDLRITVNVSGVRLCDPNAPSGSPLEC